MKWLAASAIAASISAGCGHARGPDTVQNINDMPAHYYGQEVTVMGTVDNVHSRRAFRLDAPGWFGDDILVLTKTELPGLVESVDVEVVGKVRRLDIASIERELGWDLDPDLERSYSNRPVVVAQRVQKASRPVQNGDMIFDGWFR
jgi:hypothetical protein